MFIQEFFRNYFRNLFSRISLNMNFSNPYQKALFETFFSYYSSHVHKSISLWKDKQVSKSGDQNFSDYNVRFPNPKA
jgi:hypothetical protein